VDLRIDAARLQARLAELGSVGSTGDGGCSRLALTEEDRAGRDLVVTWLRDLGLEVRIDRIGNVIALLEGTEPGPPVMCGSHIDTVATGGIYDGNLGVLAGIEVLETVASAGVPPRRAMAVAFFTDEEGSRFAPDMLGSLVYAGGMTVEDAYDIVGIDGARLGEELARIGYLGSTPCPGITPHAYVELHIEQGPVLERNDEVIGAVTGVQGISWQELRLSGQFNHAGTTPMALRHDAGFTAAFIAVFARRLAEELGGNQVATVGKLDLRPDLVNVVPGAATMTVDLRNTDGGLLEDAERRMADEIDRICTAEAVTVERRQLARFDPVSFDPRIVELVEKTARASGMPVRRLPSGAGHDAQMLARLCPAGMIFVPSVEGISHNPKEFTLPEHVEAGATMLLQVMLTLAHEDVVT
jgi:beta-ureidopropionase / N-carbamoyl-L-amino-acid hydrolase